MAFAAAGYCLRPPCRSGILLPLHTRRWQCCCCRCDDLDEDDDVRLPRATSAVTRPSATSVHPCAGSDRGNEYSDARLGCRPASFAVTLTIGDSLFAHPPQRTAMLFGPSVLIPGCIAVRRLFSGVVCVCVCARASVCICERALRVWLVCVCLFVRMYAVNKSRSNYVSAAAAVFTASTCD